MQKQIVSAHRDKAQAEAGARRKMAGFLRRDRLNALGKPLLMFRHDHSQWLCTIVQRYEEEK